MLKSLDARRGSLLVVTVAFALLAGMLPMLRPAVARAEYGEEFVGMQPVRVADTRVGAGVRAGVVQGGTVLKVPIAGGYGVPNDAGAVSLNVTVTQPSQPGWVTVFPCGSPMPVASNLNYIPGQTVANAVLARVGSDGTVCLYAQGTTHLIADLNGYFPAGSQFVGLQPARAADTRSGTGVRQGVVSGGATLRVPLADKYGVPADAYAVALNVTVTQPTAAGWITAFPCDQQLPVASNLNYLPGQTVPNMVISALGDGGVCLYAQGSTHLIADVMGYFTSNSEFIAINPERMVDTRTPDWGPALEAGETLQLQVAEPGELSAVSMNVTVTQAAGSGWVTVFPCDQPQPVASNLNYVNGQTVPNAVISQVDGNGEVCFYTQAGTHLIVDLNGVFPEPDLQGPGVVRSLTMERNRYGDITLEWINPTDSDLAEIAVLRSDGPTAPVLGRDPEIPLDSPTATTVTDQGLEPGIQYTYAVYAFDDLGNASPAATITLFDVQGPDPVRPLEVTKNLDGDVTLQWYNPYSPTAIEIVVLRSEGPTAPVLGRDPEIPLASPTATTVTDHGLTIGKQYTYSVYAFDEWGNASPAATVTLSPKTQFLPTTDVSAGGFNNCALDTDGRAWCWGTFGDTLGTGGTNASADPVPVLTTKRFKDITTGTGHTCAVTVGGTVECWGYDFYGQLGDGRDGGQTELVPISVPGLSGISQVEASYQTTCAISKTGDAWCWGVVGPDHFEESPVLVGGRHAFTKISMWGNADGNNACALDTQGVAWCWGDNTHGELGNGAETTSVPMSAPSAVGGGHRFTDISTAAGLTLAVDTAGAIWGWGKSGFYGELGDLPYDAMILRTPVLIPSSKAFVDVTVGTPSCALTASGEMWCWGYQVPGAPRGVPTRVVAGQTFKKIVGRFYAIDMQDKLWRWDPSWEATSWIPARIYYAPTTI